MYNEININELSNLREKIRIYKTEEDITFKKMKHEINKINHYYNSNNTKKLDSLTTELNRKLDVIIQNHYNYINIIDKNINQYKELEMNTEKIFDNIIER